MVTCLLQCVSSPSLSTQTAACQPAEPMQGRGVCWGAGVSKVRADPSYAEPSWNGCRGESVSCLWGTQICSEETETAGAGDSARQNMKAKSGHDTWWTQTQEEKQLPPPPLFPSARYSSPSAALRRNKTLEEEGKREKERRCSQLNSGLRSLMLPKMFREMQGSFKESFIGQS